MIRRFIVYEIRTLTIEIDSNSDYSEAKKEAELTYLDNPNEPIRTQYSIEDYPNEDIDIHIKDGMLVETC